MTKKVNKVKIRIKKSARKVKASTKKVTVKAKIDRHIVRRDAKETASLIRIGRESATHAIRESKALGLSITYMENGKLFNERADGTRELLSNESKKSVKRKPGRIIINKERLILHAKK
jgi:hypothetical protein